MVDCDEMALHTLHSCRSAKGVNAPAGRLRNNNWYWPGRLSAQSSADKTKAKEEVFFGKIIIQKYNLFFEFLFHTYYIRACQDIKQRVAGFKLETSYSAFRADVSAEPLIHS
jgi:hypothetical protein